MDTPDVPDDLNQTSGELRISNFYLWQIAYSEIYVTPTLWPDQGKGIFGPHRVSTTAQKVGRTDEQVWIQHLQRWRPVESILGQGRFLHRRYSVAHFVGWLGAGLGVRRVFVVLVMKHCKYFVMAFPARKEQLWGILFGLSLSLVLLLSGVKGSWG
jgi:hypothetical protein